MGAQLTYIAFAAKIEELKDKGKDMDRAKRAESKSADIEDAEDEDEESPLFASRARMAAWRRSSALARSATGTSIIMPSTAMAPIPSCSAFP